MVITMGGRWLALNRDPIGTGGRSLLNTPQGSRSGLEAVLARTQVAGVALVGFFRISIPPAARTVFRPKTVPGRDDIPSREAFSSRSEVLEGGSSMVTIRLVPPAKAPVGRWC